MKSVLALGWRLLLVFALVANPLAAALAAPCHDAPSPQAAAETPPCHLGMVKATEAAKLAPSGQHGHDCAKAGCDFGACCASCVLVALDAAPLLHAPLDDLGHGDGAQALAGPPLPPLIRPPIA
jgi:hypothetical protein